MLTFTPVFKSKQSKGEIKRKINPFPPGGQNGQLFRGIFTGISVEIFDRQAIKSIHESGCYGKITHTPREIIKTAETQPKKCKLNDEESLSLELEEAFFLAHILSVIEIRNLDGKLMSWGQILQACLTAKPTFIESFAVYLYLKGKNWVIKSGIKYGGDFLIYQKGVHLYHASFIVFVSCDSSRIQMAAKDIKGLQRIAETTNKDVLILEVTKPTTIKKFTFLTDFSKWTLTETIIRRFNHTAFVQKPN